ncbi:MAG: FAD-dependent oxidoreductase [Phormidesmis sp.]
MSTQKVSVCQVNELSEGEMQQFSVADRDILLVHTSGKFNALAATCSHYGAPLAKGVLHEGRIVCPWHNACYSAATGKQLEPPGRCDLAQYSVSVEDGTVYIELPDEQDEHVVPAMVESDNDNDRTFVIVGGGAAGNAAAEMLRQVDFIGRIVMLTAEQDLPYDRTKLSKAFLQGDEVKGADLLRSPTFYEKYGIEVKTNAKVKKLDIEAQQITYGDGETIEYDSLLLATGGKVNTPSMAGSDLKNVFTLRRIEDAQEILKAAKRSQRAVVIGTGFIGMEVASSLRQQGLEVTVVSPNEIPFEKVLGADVGKMFLQMHKSHEVAFKLGSKVTAIKGDKQVESVELDSGETLPADMVVVGIGVKPATDFVEQIALDEDDHSVPVNQYLQAAPGVYAAGDIAQFPHFMTGEPTRIEHWRLAMQHGQVAACNMAGQQIPFKAVPFFWTGQFDLKLRYIGHAEKWDDVVIQGSLDDKSFLAFYVQNDRVMAVAGAGRDQDIAAISELMRIGDMPAVNDVKESDINWASRLK